MRKRTVPVYFMLSETEAKKLKKIIEDLGIKKTVYIRACLFGMKIPCVKQVDYKELKYELNRIGNNLNQLTRNSNMGKSIDRDSLSVLIDDFQKIEEKILRKLENTE